MKLLASLWVNALPVGCFSLLVSTDREAICLCAKKADYVSQTEQEEALKEVGNV